MNSSTAKVRTLKGSSGFTQKTWKDVKVGDICWIEDHEIISADMVVICSSLDSGVVFIETSSLDGEKNLKPK
jgi:P-type E1-E2 ATPase